MTGKAGRMNKEETQDLETQDTREDRIAAHMALLFGFICRAGCQVEAIESLEDYALRDMVFYLEAWNPESGVPAMIRGLVTVEACNRFCEKTEDVEEYEEYEEEEDGQ